MRSPQEGTTFHGAYHLNGDLVLCSCSPTKAFLQCLLFHSDFTGLVPFSEAQSTSSVFVT